MAIPAIQESVVTAAIQAYLATLATRESVATQASPVTVEVVYLDTQEYLVGQVILESLDTPE